MAVVKRSVTPERSGFKFNPIIPFYSYEARVEPKASNKKGLGSDGNFLGGLIGVETTADQQKRIRFLWIF